MSASHTLRRGMTHRFVTLPDGQKVTVEAPARPKPLKKGTPFRRVTTLEHPTQASPYEVTFHATKGRRVVRVAV